jgi:hypothetical protein
VLLAVERTFPTNRTRQLSKGHSMNKASGGLMWRMSNLQALIFIAAVARGVAAGARLIEGSERCHAVTRRITG